MPIIGPAIHIFLKDQPMHTHQVRFIVGLSTLALPALSFAQTTGGNPLNTLPPIHSPQPAPQPATIAPDTALQTEKQLNARQLQLSTLITPQRIDISGVKPLPLQKLLPCFSHWQASRSALPIWRWQLRLPLSCTRRRGTPCPLSICPRRLLKTASCA